MNFVVSFVVLAVLTCAGNSAFATAYTAGPSYSDEIKNELLQLNQDTQRSQLVLKKVPSLGNAKVELLGESEAPLVFDIPVTYNRSVKFWIRNFQTSNRSWFKKWLERSTRYMPFIQKELKHAGLPQDLAYLAMIESGFSTAATSNAEAVGIWQFIEPTGNSYGLRTEWWLDERRDYDKSTQAAIEYISHLYRSFKSWYIVAASYNMGETRARKTIQKYNTNNFWKLADLGALPDETKNYVPKIIAAMLIAKAPALYGFRELEYHLPERYDYFHAPGGTDLNALAEQLGVSPKYLRDLNPELTRGYIPKNIRSHRIRVPKGSMQAIQNYLKSNYQARID